jgi:hypothetical protein
MMKKVILIAFILLGNFYSWAQLGEIPKNVTYKTTSESENNKAIAILKKAIDDPQKGKKLFDGILFIGPQLWTKLSQIKTLNAIEGGNVNFQIPQGDGKSMEKKGKLIQNETDFQLVWNELATRIGQDYNIRKLNSLELSYYWSIINFDIEEPIFLFENKSYKFIIDINKSKLIWLEQY